MRYQGRITEWNDPRGFGFITPLDGSARVFVHVMAFPSGSRRPSPGEYVSYSLGRDEKGRPRAERAAYVVSSAQPTKRSEARVGLRAAACVSGGVLIGIVVAAAVGKLPLVVPAIYIVCSGGAYRSYRNDKKAALRKEWRTDEVELLTWGLFGGWPGALVAQHQFHHKTRKSDFQIAFWTTVVLNCLGLAIVAW